MRLRWNLDQSHTLHAEFLFSKMFCERKSRIFSFKACLSREIPLKAEEQLDLFIALLQILIVRVLIDQV